MPTAEPEQPDTDAGAEESHPTGERQAVENRENDPPV
jgi:hypothetical protein